MTMSSPAGFLSSQSRAEAEPLSQISDILKPGRKQKSYRPAQPLPYELRQHCVVFLAEELCTVNRFVYIIAPSDSSD